jgi:hypothetical protein
MRHKNSLSFVNQSQPAEAEPSALELHRAAHPAVRELQDAATSEFREKWRSFQEDLCPMLTKFVAKAESARQIGIALIEFTDTLPGKKLTRDFYEQTKHWFADAQGVPAAFELLEWFMAVARKNESPIESMATALKYVQPLLLSSGDPAFQLVSDATPKQRIPPQDEWGKLTSWLENPELEQTWNALKKNPAYFPDGHLRADLRTMLAEEWKPKFAVIEEFRKELGI